MRATIVFRQGCYPEVTVNGRTHISKNLNSVEIPILDTEVYYYDGKVKVDTPEDMNITIREYDDKNLNRCVEVTITD